MGRLVDHFDGALGMRQVWRRRLKNASLVGIVMFVCVAEHEALAGGIATTCIHIMSGHIVYNFVLHVYMQTPT